MRFLIYPAGCTPFHRRILDERPLGGVETAIIGLSEGLAALGHEVFVISELDVPSEGNPHYLLMEKTKDIGEVDVYIVIRDYRQVFCPFRYKKCYYWTGDSYDIITGLGIGDLRFSKFITALLGVSNWHINALCQFSGFPLEKAHVLRNGIFLSRFQGTEQRIRKRLIYTSHPNRGLKYLPEIFPRLRERHPDAELHIFSGNQLYRPLWTKEFNHSPKWNPLMEQLKAIPQCTVHGNVLQHQLARELMKSAVWVYPTDFEETSCISAMEAQAAGCAIVTSALAALEETVGGQAGEGNGGPLGGILLTEKPGTKEYIDSFIDAVDTVLSDDALFQRLSQASLQRAQRFDWKIRAQSLVDFASMMVV